jgi:two-component system LytT family response regulator
MIRAILVDDEIHCIDTLSILIKDYCPDVEILDKCYSAKAALDVIEKASPELIFLDIEMPVMNGFELLQQFKEFPFAVIFTTSSTKYAYKRSLHPPSNFEC